MLVSDAKNQNIQKLQKRANLPKYFRFGAIAALVLTVLAIGIGFYIGRSRQEFRLKPEHAKLSKDVVAEVNGYERTETEGDVKKFYIKADKATTYSDNHQELQNVLLKVFDEKGEGFDQITSDKALYIPADNKNFTTYFAGNVNIETRDVLKVKTEQIVYTKDAETVETEDLIEFEKENISGKSLGAFIRIREKKFELMKDVEINAFALNPQDELTKSKIQSAKITASYAMFDQTAEKIELKENVFIGIIPNGQNAQMSQPTDIRSNHAVAGFTNKEIRQIDLTGNVDVYQKPTSANSKWTRTTANKAVTKIENELKSVELTENVEIETTTNDAKPTKINTQFALYEKDIDRFHLKNGVHIITVEDASPTNIKASEAIYEQTNGRIFLNGNAEIDSGNEYLKGDNLTAELYPTKKIKYSYAKGNAYLKQTSPDQTTEVSANELNAIFNENEQMQAANTLGTSHAVLVPAQAADYSKVTLSAPNAIHLNFRTDGLLDQMQTEGRTTIQMNAPKTSADAANKILTADAVKTVFNPNGKDLTRAEAVGNAELLIEPLQNSATNYKTTITAPRFDCEFFPTGNNAKVCIVQTKTKTVRVPTVPDEKRGMQTLLADKLHTQFNQQTQDLKQIDALGNAKFSELDRHGIANQINFTADDQVVRFRGGEPTVWDSKARAKADEIDWDTKSEKSFLRGNVSTTYYNQKQTNGATPFTAGDKPVYLTSANAEFNHAEETGLYTGNARAWQENNYVRAEKLLLKQKEGQLFGEGSVQSVLYNTKKQEKAKESSVPVYASSQKLFYNRENRILRYEENVDIRQGTDRITAGLANVYLNEKNEMSKTIAETNVVITQPTRRAIGDWVQYTAENEIAILRGNPARIEDSENGSSQGAEVSIYMRENRVTSEAKTEQNNTGRTKTVYKIKKND